MGGRKENSKVARLKRQLEKIGFKGIGDSSSGGVGSRNNSMRYSNKMSPKAGGAAGGRYAVGKNSEILRLTSPTALNTPTAGDSKKSGAAGSTSLSIAALSPQRVRSSLSMGGRRLSAWTFGNGGQIHPTTAADAAAGGTLWGADLLKFPCAGVVPSATAHSVWLIDGTMPETEVGLKDRKEKGLYAR